MFPENERAVFMSRLRIEEAQMKIKTSEHRARLFQCQAWLLASHHHFCSFRKLPLPRRPQEWGHATSMYRPGLSELPSLFAGNGIRGFCVCFGDAEC